MKPLIILSFVILALSSCTKTDRSYITLGEQSNALAPLNKCDVSSYPTIMFTGVTFGNGLSKTYYPGGLVKTVRTMVTDEHDYADSLIYKMTYWTSPGVLNVDITCLKRHYFGIGFGETPILLGDESYTISAKIDSGLKRLVKIYGSDVSAGSFTMKYDNKRLLQFGSIALKYDSNGNVTWIPKRPPSYGGSSVLYQYNHSKKAANQYYITSGYSVHEYYNLAEICGWIPVQPVNLRVRQSMFWGNYKAGDLFFDSHVIDAQGYLISYRCGPLRDGSLSTTVTNAWMCR